MPNFNDPDILEHLEDTLGTVRQGCVKHGTQFLELIPIFTASSTKLRV